MMAEIRDDDLRLALDALDACQVPPAAPGWETRLLDTLRAQPRRTGASRGIGGSRRASGSRLRLLVAACVALAVFVFLASGAGAWVGLPNPFSAAYHHLRPPVHKLAPAPHHSALVSPSSPSPAANHSATAKPTPSPRPSAVGLAPPSWPLAPAGRDVWRRRDSGTHATLTNVAFVDSAHGWAVGGPHGAVLATSDGGASWAPLPTGYRRWLSGVAFVDAAHGWVVGTGPNGTVILTTSDGGASWSKTHMQGWFAHIAAVDATHVWAAGHILRLGRTDARVIASSDGQIWRTQRVNAARDLTDVCFTDALHGWAAGPNAIVATIDGGVTWRQQTVPAGLRLYAVSFLDSQRGWAAGAFPSGSPTARAVVLATSDGGATWRRISLGDRSTAIFDLTFADQKHGWALAYGQTFGQHAAVLATSDGGGHWRTERLPTGFVPAAVTAVSSAGACVVGRDGAIFSTTLP